MPVVVCSELSAAMRRNERTSSGFRRGASIVSLARARRNSHRHPPWLGYRNSTSTLCQHRLQGAVAVASAGGLVVEQLAKRRWKLSET